MGRGCVVACWHRAVKTTIIKTITTTAWATSAMTITLGAACAAHQRASTHILPLTPHTHTHLCKHSSHPQSMLHFFVAITRRTCSPERARERCLFCLSPPICVCVCVCVSWLQHVCVCMCVSIASAAAAAAGAASAVALTPQASPSSFIIENVLF